MKTAFITGITGQDGYYLSKLLIENGYKVHGTIRRSSTFNTSRIDGLISEHSESGNLKLYYSDLLDSSSINNLINSIQPDEVYNLAAQSHVAVSFKNPLYSTNTSVVGPLTLLEAIRNLDKEIKFYQASSSEMYGGRLETSLNEESPFEPLSPYAAGKVFAHNITKIYRESYGIFAVNGILFNHESPHRGETFVTRKITRAVGRIYYEMQNKLTLGNLDARRDWGFAGDYVNGMWKMLQHDSPDDWVLATGESHSVEEFSKLAFEAVGLNYSDYIETSEDYKRPNEVNYLLGDPSKAKKELNWETKVSFQELVEMMVKNDLELAKKEKTLLDKNLISPTWENPNKN
ncbi:MAG: GDP-mannose 4,6-dehydratase [Euryarchaeota archaeon]|nr:GDP-mannose 4,6-dehydratase [Euryarchaeota archaeon]|tara:strand:- start:5722 stop:6759 length:1038 start_codon:yes stop_codon:yes gene_type:complete